MRNRETINHLFLDFSSTDRMVVYSMDELYHQIQRVADTVRTGGRGGNRGGSERREMRRWEDIRGYIFEYNILGIWSEA